MDKLMIMVATLVMASGPAWADGDPGTPLAWDGDWSIDLPRLERVNQLATGAGATDVVQISPRGIIQLWRGRPGAFDALPGPLAAVEEAHLVAPFWAELADAPCPGLDDPGGVFYAEGLDEAGRPTLTIRWVDMPRADCRDDGRASFAVALTPLEGGLRVVFVYHALPTPRVELDGAVIAPRAGVRLFDQTVELLPDAPGKGAVERVAGLLAGGEPRLEPGAPARWVIEFQDGRLVGDGDGDGVRDEVDNCRRVANPWQENADRRLADLGFAVEPDDAGDACDTDDDGDGPRDDEDNCPFIPNFDQADLDGDGVGDVCDDTDADARLDADDNCPLIANAPQVDTDADGSGDVCDLDDDGDGLDDPDDNCPAHANPDQRDLDRDGSGDVCDIDADADGVKDALDNCRLTFNPGQFDQDADRRGDVCDADPDGDGVPTSGAGGRPGDRCPWRADPAQRDRDGDRLGDACDAQPDRFCVVACDALEADADGDGVTDAFDRCPLAFDPGQFDQDGDAKGDACDPDADGDGVIDVLQGRCFVSAIGPLGWCGWMHWTGSSGHHPPKAPTEVK